jgi:hypothetical protein
MMTSSPKAQALPELGGQTINLLDKMYNTNTNGSRTGRRHQGLG